jgi:hypothetical protein
MTWQEYEAGLEGRLADLHRRLHPDKTRRIEFGRYAQSNRERRGEGKPETFDLLGFTHISGKERERVLCCATHDSSQAHAQEAAGNQAATSNAYARSSARIRCLARISRARLLQLLRCSGEPR